ncbi:MAG: HEAT repeat domain-containing protein [Thermodesulfovibrionales bacterium]|nr:HEAT repeat domain-containing protein [Thermodesulfovibrionales bacterium]
MRENKRIEKAIPKCPFCGSIISRPEETKTDFGKILSGKCDCKTIYVCDLTGHCVGEAYMEALVLLKGDWDIGLLEPDKDYSYAEMDYDYKTHKRILYVSKGESHGKLVFLKPLKVEPALLELNKGDERPTTQRKVGQKKILRELLKNKEIDKIIEMSKKDKGIINQLFSFTYDKGDIITWLTIESIGLIAQELAKKDEDIEFIRNTARRLLWAMTEESGGISWSAPEILGEIIRSNPKEFYDLIPIVWSNRGEEVFTEGVIWAMGRIAEVAPESVSFIYEDLKKLINHPNPTVRGYTIWVLEKISNSETINLIRDHENDDSQIQFYKDRSLFKTTVGEVARKAINIIS